MLLLFRDKIGNGIQKSLQLDHDLPPIVVDPNQMKQVMINIIKNSIEAMPGGGALTIITRETQNRSGRKIVEVIFKDTGCGIDEFDLKKIFQPFYSTKEKGAGMGLAICERIIQNHGGEIKVESQIGKGAQFVVSLPSKVSLN
jgi:signal transduction histidine kinase